MNGPSYNWLQNLNAQLGAGQPANEYPSLAELGGMPPPAPPAAPTAGPPPPPPVQAPPPAVQASMPAAGGAPPVQNEGVGAMPPDVQFMPVGGGASPARELYMRGPQQDAALMGSFDAPAEAAGRVDFRNQVMADKLDVEYERQAADALARQEAADRVQARRQAEMQGLMSDYQDQVQKLGQMHLDDNRWWAKKTTGDKIGTILLTALGGIAALDPKGNGRNLAYERVMQEMDNDLAAQRFDAQMQMEQGRGAQNAFAMMLDRYGSEDAAMAASRASAIDFAAAKINQLHAQYGGAESANARDELLAKLDMEKQRTIAAGFKFVPAGLQQKKYKMMIRGQEIPGLVDEKTAQTYAVEHGVKPAETVDQELVKGGIQSTIQSQKIAAEHAAKGRENAVALPNGETVFAPSSQEATTLRGLSSAVLNAQQLVSEAKAIRSDPTWLTSPTKGKRLKQISAELTLAFKDRGQLGALSGPDMDLARNATADLTSIMPGVDDQLDSFAKTTSRALQNRVRSIPGAPANASGQLSSAAKASFQPHGKK